MNWTYNGQEATELPTGHLGFIYIIRYTDGTFYIGKKKAISVTKKKFGVRKLAAMTDKRLKTYEYVVKEAKWKEYEGSSENSKDKTIKSKEILTWCRTMRGMTYLEVKAQFDYDVLLDPLCLNANILKKFFRDVLDKEEIQK